MTKDKVSAANEPLRVLVVDDEEDLLELLCVSFNSAGCKAQGLSHFKDAAQLLSKEHFDLVLCDIRMPGGGIEDLLLAYDRFQGNPRMVAITGFAEREKETALREQGVLVLEKPFSFASLKPLLDDLARSKNHSF